MSTIQQKIYDYFDRDPELKVLFIFNQEFLAMELEGLEWRSGYHYVDDNTDKEVVKIDYDTLREKIKKEFPLKFKFTEKDVEKAIEKIPEVFTIVSKDRLTFI